MINRNSVILPADLFLGFLQKQTISFADEGKWKFHYDIFDHAERMLSREESDHDRACVIFQINRAIDMREKLLNEYYNFRRMPGFKGKKQHEIMVSIGMSKQILKKKVDNIRNRVMHIAESPVPDRLTCEELVEFTWYFLKATDVFVASIVDDCCVPSASGDELPLKWLELSVDRESWEFTFRGAMKEDFAIDEIVDRCVEIECFSEAKKKEDGYIYFHGKPKNVENVGIDMLKSYFRSFY